MKSARSRKTRWIALKFAFLAAAAAGLFVFLRNQKGAVVRECVGLLEKAVSRGTDLELKIGRVRAKFFGRLTLEDIEVSADSPAGPKRIFTCRKAVIQYNVLEFISKGGHPGFTVELQRPVISWTPHLSLRPPSFPLLGWMREWAIQNRRDIEFRTTDLEISPDPAAKPIGPIRAVLRGDRFEAEIPFSHVPVASADLSTVVKIEGRFELGIEASSDILGGRISTLGTVVDWNPVKRESEFEFVLSRERIRVYSPDFFGGVLADLEVDFTDAYALSGNVAANGYPLSNLSHLAGVSAVQFPGKISFDLKIGGDIWAPALTGAARIEEGRVGKKSFQALDIHVDGVYPTVRLFDSRILTDEGSTMRLADTSIEIHELFDDKTYRDLVSEAQQDTVVWGDWELTRMKNESEQSDLLMQRSFGEHAKLRFRKKNEEPDQPEGLPDREDRNDDLEVGFDYRLRGNDTLKFEVREGEEFVGVERKMRF